MFRANNSPSKNIVKKLINNYAKNDDWHEINKKTRNLGYGWIHYGLIRLLKPSRVLCVGSRYGFIPAICALACRDNGKGIVDFVDAGFDQNIHGYNHWGGVGTWKKINPDKYFGKMNLNKHIKLHVMTTEKFKKKYPKRKWGYIHLDGDHSYKGIKFDYRSFWPSLKASGFMAFHDIKTKKLGGFDYGVERFWKELKTKNKNKLEFDGKCGLGVIQKK